MIKKVKKKLLTTYKLICYTGIRLCRHVGNILCTYVNEPRAMDILSREMEEISVEI